MKSFKDKFASIYGIDDENYDMEDLIVNNTSVELEKGSDTLKYLLFDFSRETSPGRYEKIFKAIKLVKIKRIPKKDLAITSFLDMQAGVVTGYYQNQINFLQIWANIVKPERIGLIFAYGVQGVSAVSIEDAKRQADIQMAGLMRGITGTFRTLEYTYLSSEEASWIIQRLGTMKNLSVLRGIPAPKNSNSKIMSSTFFPEMNAKMTGEEQNEEFLLGMDEFDYILVLTATVVDPATLSKWREANLKEATYWAGLQTGNKSINVGLSMPMVFAANAGTNTGWGHNTGQSFGENYGTNYSHAQGSSVTFSEGTSHSLGTSTNHGTNVGANKSQSINETYGESYTESMGQTSGVSIGQGSSIGINRGESSGISHSFGQNSSVSDSTSTSTSHSSGISGSSSHSIGNSNSSSTSHSDSTGSSSSTGENWGTGNNVSQGSSWNQSAGESSGTNKGVNGSLFGIGGNASFTDSTSISAGQGGSTSSGSSSSHGNSISNSTSQSSSDSYSNSHSNSVSDSTSSGWNEGISESVSNSHGTSNGISESWGTTQGSSIGSSEGLSNSYSENYSNSFSQSHGTTHSVGKGYSEGTSVGESWGDGTSESVSTTQSVSHGTSVTDSVGSSQGTSTGRSLGNSISGGYSSGASGSMGLGPSIGFSKMSKWEDKEVTYLLDQFTFANNRIIRATNGLGMWFTDIYIATDSDEAETSASALAMSAWHNKNALTTPLHVYKPSPIEQEYLFKHLSVFSPSTLRDGNPGKYESYKYTSLLLSDEINAFTHPPRVNVGGIQAAIDDPPVLTIPNDRQKGPIFLGYVADTEKYNIKSGYKSSFKYCLTSDEIMHAYVSGASRSGKTVVCRRLVAEAYNNVRRGEKQKRLRFVIMDPKQDWRALAKIIPPEHFRFYSLSDPTFHPCRLNLMRIPHGVYTDRYADKIREIFVRSYGLGDRAFQILFDAIVNVYKRAGCYDENVRYNKKDPVTGKFPASELSKNVTFTDVVQYLVDQQQAPENIKLRDKTEAIGRILDRMGTFTQETSPVYTIFCNRGEDGMSIDALLGNDDVIVLESYGMDTKTSAFIFGLLTSSIYQYAVSNNGFVIPDDQYETVLVIEEANQVLIGNEEDNLGGSNPFENILDQSAGYGLFIWTITQKIHLMPDSVLANSALKIIGRQDDELDIQKTITQIGKDANLADRVFKNWLPDQPIGWFIIKSSRNKDFTKNAPVHVLVEYLDIQPPNNEELQNILDNSEIFRNYKELPLNEKIELK